MGDIGLRDSANIIASRDHDSTPNPLHTLPPTAATCEARGVLSSPN
jgi:hypothetical protein